MAPTALLSFASALLLSACAQQQASPSPAAGAAGACNEQPARFAVGYIYTDALQDEVRSRSGSSAARVLRPGQVTTMEFSAQRVNIQVDAGNRVVAVRCG